VDPRAGLDMEKSEISGPWEGKVRTLSRQPADGRSTDCAIAFHYMQLKSVTADQN
jgi:hypothetical protein